MREQRPECTQRVREIETLLYNEKMTLAALLCVAMLVCDVWHDRRHRYGTERRELDPDPAEKP